MASSAARVSFSESAIVFLHIDDEGYRSSSSPILSSTLPPPPYSEATINNNNNNNNNNQITIEGKVEEKKMDTPTTANDTNLSNPPSIKKPRIVLNMADRVPQGDTRSRRDIIIENFHAFINHWSYYLILWLSLILVLFGGLGLYNNFGDRLLYAWGVYWLICFLVLFAALIRGSIRLKQEKLKELQMLKEAEQQLKNNIQ